MTCSFNMKKLIFDFDGVLVDSMPMWERVVLGILDEHNIPYPEDFYFKAIPMGVLGVSKHFVNKMGLKMTVEECFNKISNLVLKEYMTVIPAKEGTYEALTHFKEKGYSLNVLTASPENVVKMCLGRLNLFDFFDNVWSCDEFKTDKTDVKLFSQVSEILQVEPSDCIMLDDSMLSLKTAKSAEMKVIGVYDKVSGKQHEQEKHFCDGYIYSFKELLNIIP